MISVHTRLPDEKLVAESGQLLVFYDSPHVSGFDVLHFKNNRWVPDNRDIYHYITHWDILTKPEERNAVKLVQPPYNIK